MSTGSATFDPHVSLLCELLEVLDSDLKRIEQAIRQSPDPDSFGEFERGEHLFGLAFVACQTYIAATCGRLGGAKREALTVGESVADGVTKAGLVNDADHFWKHHLEPRADAAARGVSHRTRDALTAAGIPRDASYPLSNVLATLLPGRASRLKGLANVMTTWRSEVEERGRRTTRCS
jgi:hypothetical protein